MIKVGVIGSGDWGKNHLRVYSEIDCELVGLADINNDKKELADKYKIKFFTDYKQLLPLVDAVSVVVPTDKHYVVVKYCLEQGKHVLVEKPVTLDPKSAKELIELAKSKNLLLAVGYLFRFNSAVIRLKEEIKSIGKIQAITGRYIHSNKPPRKDSGVIFNFAIHLVDILNYILEKSPKKVFCKKINFLSEEREDYAFINLDYGNFIANLEVSWFHPLKSRDLWIIGSKAKIYTDLFEQIIIKYPIEISYEKTLSKPPINLEVNKNEPLKDELKSFCECIKNSLKFGKFLTLRNSVGISKKVNKNIKFKGEEEILTTRICELALLSAKSGEEMVIDE